MKVLEDKVPGLAAKLPPHLRKAIDADGTRDSSEQTLQERLSHLENAMAILLKNQVSSSSLTVHLKNAMAIVLKSQVSGPWLTLCVCVCVSVCVCDPRSSHIIYAFARVKPVQICLRHDNKVQAEFIALNDQHVAYSVHATSVALM